MADLDRVQKDERSIRISNGSVDKWKPQILIRLVIDLSNTLIIS